ncbi:MAG TPA: hypothetical protein VHZ56_12705, partial [Devosia sp.]|nr:hypothetical protein [Devosia sp.]
MTIHPEPSESERFRDIVADRFGLRFEDAKLGDLGDLLHRRAQACGIDAMHYLAYVDDSGPEDGRLAEELTVGETYFFRNGDQFRALEHVLRARIRTPSATRRLSVLSAG